MEASNEEKPLRVVLQIRNSDYRPLIRGMADVLDVIKRNAFSPIGGLRGKVIAGPDFLAGQYGALCQVEGTTATENFAINLPFISGFSGIDQNGIIRRFRNIRSFDKLPISLEGRTLFDRNNFLHSLKFDVVDLPFHWGQMQINLAILLARYANHIGLSQRILGRELADDPSFSDLAALDISSLGPVVQFVNDHWQTISNDRPPSRQTISDTLAAVSMRQQRRRKSRSKFRRNLTCKRIGFRSSRTKVIDSDP